MAAFGPDGAFGAGLGHQGNGVAIDEEGLPVDVGGVVGGQIADEGRDAVRVEVLQFAVVAGVAGEGGDAAAGADFGGGFGDGANHSGGGAGGDGVGGYAVAAHIFGDHFGEAGDAAFGGAIVGLAAVADEAGLAAEGDDPSGALLPEQDAGVFDYGEGALEVNGDDVVPFLFGHIEHHTVAQDAGAADRDVQPSEVVDGRLDDALAAVHSGD